MAQVEKNIVSDSSSHNQADTQTSEVLQALKEVSNCLFLNCTGQTSAFSIRCN